jgi:hypothetical protein
MSGVRDVVNQFFDLNYVTSTSHENRVLSVSVINKPYSYY